MPITHKATLPFCRPGEPSFMQKMNCRFDIPADHLPPRYKDIGVDILERFNDENIQKLPVKPIEYPNLDFFKHFDRNAQFSIFNPQHMSYAKALMRIFDSAKDLDELISIALYCRDQVNTQLFIYAYSVVLTHRKDTDNIQLPQAFEIVPHQFFKKNILSEAREKLHGLAEMKRNKRQTNDDNDDKAIEVPFRRTMSVANKEEKLDFFREDIGLNSHHYHWHIVYPWDTYDFRLLEKDRRGELFYFMHHQLLNWYDCTRMALGVPTVKKFDDFRKEIDEGYYSNLTTNTTSMVVPPRQAKTYLQDLYRPNPFELGTRKDFQVSNCERWLYRLHEAIDNGFCVNEQGKKIDLLNDKGVDNLVNMIEANPLSKNLPYYGDIHNVVHELLAFAHDPEMKYNESASIMGSTGTACRDPIFYRWHKTIDNLCVKLKDRLPPYQKSELQFTDITIKSLNILNESDESIEQLCTFWQKSTVNLQHGLDFENDHPILVNFTHLNYQHFTYAFEIENQNAVSLDGIVRIYLLPKNDEKGNPMVFNLSRKMAIEIDRFRAKFPPGTSKLVRKSVDSAVTIPFDEVFPMQRDGKILLSDEPDDIQAVCMCGWPQHMLLPKGNEDGYPYRIFSMISDYKLDKIDQSPSNGVCNDNYVLCGLRNRKYPDRRTMGFPFDHRGNEDISNLDEFMSPFKNMITKNVTIRHLNENTAITSDKKIVKL